MRSYLLLLCCLLGGSFPLLFSVTSGTCARAQVPTVEEVPEEEVYYLEESVIEEVAPPPPPRSRNGQALQRRVLTHAEATVIYEYGEGYGLKGFKDASGRIVLPAKYKEIKVLPNNGNAASPIYFLVKDKDNYYNVVNTAGENSFPNPQIYLVHLGLNQVAATDLQTGGTIVTQYNGQPWANPNYRSWTEVNTGGSLPEAYRKDYVLVREGYNKTGLINKQGRFVIPLMDHGIRFTDNFISVTSNDSDRTPSRVMSPTMKTLWMSDVESIYATSADRFWVGDRKTGERTLMNAAGEQVAGPFNVEVRPLGEHFSAQDTHRKRYGILDKNGRWIVPADYFGISHLNRAKHYLLTDTLFRKSVVDASGTTLIPFDYDDIQETSVYDADRKATVYLMARRAGRHDLFDVTGKSLLRKPAAAVASPQSNFVLLAYDGLFYLHDLKTGKRVYKTGFVTHGNFRVNTRLNAAIANNYDLGRTILYLAHTEDEQPFVILRDGRVLSVEEFLTE